MTRGGPDCPSHIAAGGRIDTESLLTASAVPRTFITGTQSKSSARVAPYSESCVGGGCLRGWCWKPAWSLLAILCIQCRLGTSTPPCKRKRHFFEVPDRAMCVSSRALEVTPAWRGDPRKWKRHSNTRAFLSTWPLVYAIGPKNAGGRRGFVLWGKIPQ